MAGNVLVCVCVCVRERERERERERRWGGVVLLKLREVPVTDLRTVSFTACANLFSG